MEVKLEMNESRLNTTLAALELGGGSGYRGIGGGRLLGGWVVMGLLYLRLLSLNSLSSLMVGVVVR